MECAGFPQLRISQILLNLRISQNSSNAQKNPELPEKSRLLEKREFLSPWPTPTYKLSTPPMVWNISTGQLGLAAWLCSLPAPALLIS